MVYVMGGIHIDFAILLDFAESEVGRRLTRDDYVIALGELGVWPETLSQLKELSEKLNFTLLFVEGNHEHYPLLYSFAKRRMLGGTVRDVFGIYHLCRGEIYSIPTEDKEITVAVCGGADSKDKNKRTEGVDWFSEERISGEDVDRTLENAAKHGMRVDYFLSHALSAAVKIEWNYEYLSCPVLGGEPMQITESDYRIRDIAGSLEARMYLSAHEHIDRQFILGGRMHRSVHKDFVRLDPPER